MAALGSSRWFDALEDALNSTAGSLKGDRVHLGQVITGSGPQEIAYTIHVGGGEPPRLERGSVRDADVVLVEDADTAAAIASGTPAAELLGAGRLKLRGSISALVEAQDQLGEIGAALGRAMRANHDGDPVLEQARRSVGDELR